MAAENYQQGAGHTREAPMLPDTVGRRRQVRISNDVGLHLGSVWDVKIYVLLREDRHEGAGRQSSNERRDTEDKGGEGGEGGEGGQQSPNPG